MDRSENQTSIETKPIKETLKRPPAADPELFQSLTNFGFSENTAAKLLREHPADTIRRQLSWLPQRAPARSPAGLLRRAIEQNWPVPTKLRLTEVHGTRGWDFARYFYAAFGGNRGEPVNDPSPRDAETASGFVQRLLKVCGDESQIPEWGRRLGQMARDQRNPFPSLQLAVRQLGDAMIVRIEKERLFHQLETVTGAREVHEAAHRDSWLQWLASQEEEIKRTTAEEYARFLAKRERYRSDLAATAAPWAAAGLASFESDGSRLHALRQFFGLPDFWAWDAEFNNHRFNPNLPTT